MRSLVWIAVTASLAVAVPARAEAIETPGLDRIGVRIDPGPVFLTSAQRRSRAELIRDTAAAAGMTNAALLAGIGEVETNFAHCWSEATWACKGPNSSSCGNGPVIAGASDGACSLQQGGLGMFQFDSGTFSQTIATYGPDIVTLQGNVNAVIPFLLTRAVESVEGVNTRAEALAWMNSIRIADGDAKYEAWLYFVAWRYNGCKGCTTQINKYRNGTNKLRDEFGPEFWQTSGEPPPACGAIPVAGRTIEETDVCFTRTGTETSWYQGDRGMDGACLYTYATDDAAPDNQGTWELRFEADGRYRVEVYTDGGDLAQTRQAKYVVTHAAGKTDVVIDQSATTGFRGLGTFEFIAGEPFSVTLGDNTGEKYIATAKIGIAFDAVRVAPVDGAPDDAGGCSTSDAGAGGTLLLVGLALVVSRRRASLRRPLISR
ncbi:MAG: hypothetical protein H0T89_31390 [Deltaproteobacteria bacterium]|nr:hypothetical protein [Deltaproteobacteria bacterium]MDQ3298190.1 MYXO-CTERM sorting domain-containing protein [Myxococcota bacterium]